MIPLIHTYLDNAVFSKLRIMLQNSQQFIYNIIILQLRHQSMHFNVICGCTP